MEKCGAENQRQHASDLLVHAKTEKPKQAEADQCAEHADQNVRGVADENIAHGRVHVVAVKHRQALDVCADDIRGKHQQGLADAVPAVELAVAAVNAKVRIVLGVHGRLGSPERVRGLQAVSSVARTEFTGLHDERRKKRYEPQEKRRISKQTAEAGGHRGWRILVHARAGFKRRQTACQQLAQAKSCRDLEGSLRYSHAGVAEWQTRRTQNSNQGFPLSVLLCAEVQCYEAVASKLLVRCCDEL